MEIIEELFLTLKYASKDMIVLPGDNLSGTLKYCTILATVSCISTIMKLPTLKDFRGALLAVLILKIINMKGRNKYGIPRDNGDGKHSPKADTGRKEDTNTEESTTINSDDFRNDF